MNKQARALLKKINDLKNEIRGLQGQGKTQDMKDKMENLRNLQAEFDMLMEMDDDDEGNIGNQIHKGTALEVDGAGGAGGEGQKPKNYTKPQVIRAFVNRIVCGLRGKKMEEEDIEIMDVVSGAMNEGSDEDGGFTVPQDIQTDIMELRRTDDDLEQYVNREPVTTMQGSRVIEKDADSTPWEDVEEGGEFQEADTPKLAQIKYKIGKKGGILKTTYELLQDSAVNILTYLNKWIAKKSRATRNAAILKVLDTITKSKEVAIESFDDLKTVFNVTLDPAIAASSIVLTNQDGFNWLDTQKNEKGEYIMQPDVTDATKHLLFGVYPVIKISNKVLKTDTSGEPTHKIPIFMGDLKEAVTLFDREKITVELSTEAGDLWAKDLTGIKVRDRFDVQKVDEAAVVKGEVSISVEG